MICPGRLVRGFSLIELLVTLAIGVVILAVAAPSFVTFQRNAALTSTVNTLLSAANAARGEAMKRGTYASVVPTDSANWGSGWIVFVDNNRNGVYDSATDTIVLQTEPPPAYVLVTPSTGATASASPPYIMFNAQGYSQDKSGGFGANTVEFARNDVSGTELLKQTRRLKIAATGRVRVCTPTSTSDTNCNATISSF